MSSLDDDPKLTEGLVHDCLAVITGSRLAAGTEVPLRRVGQEAYSRQNASILRRLAALVEDKTKGEFTIRPADPVIFDGTPLIWGTYFVRCAKDAITDDVVTTPSEGMVFYAINPHRSMLIVGPPVKSAEEIEAALQQRAVERAAEIERAARRAATEAAIDEEVAQILSRIEFYTEASGDPTVRSEWQRMRNEAGQRLTLRQLLVMCHRLGIDLTNLTVHLTTASA